MFNGRAPFPVNAERGKTESNSQEFFVLSLVNKGANVTLERD